MTLQIRERKWIKPGVEVAHRDYPSRKMIAEEVIKITKDLKIGDKFEKHRITVGVWCHWFDENGRYDRGRFMTMELIPFGAVEDGPNDNSFGKEIPSVVPDQEFEEFKDDENYK